MSESGWVIDPAIFAENAVPDEAARLNRSIVQTLQSAPQTWERDAAEVRQARAEGRGIFPLTPADPDAETIRIEGRHGPIEARIIRPKTRPACGTYLHFHGGGWMFGAARENDARLRGLAEATGLVTLSVDYALAPERPYPQGPDDCEDAALWLLGGVHRDITLPLPRQRLAIGGESAGAHLALVTLMRLRDRHGATPFHAGLLTAGCFDLAGTPSVRNWGTERLILATADIDNFVVNFVGRDADLGNPDLSPLNGRLHGLPPMLLTCGTRDLLLDDTLFMAARLAAAGVGGRLSLYPGGCHVFQSFDTAQARESLAEMAAFLTETCRTVD
jgi:acetyl esterase